MSKKWGLLIVVLVIVSSITGYFVWNKTSAPSPGAGGLPPAVISATEVIEEQWRPSLRSVGSLVAINGISISTEVNGIVSDIVFNSGDPVKKGQVLVRLDNSVDVAALGALQADEKTCSGTV